MQEQVEIYKLKNDALLEACKDALNFMNKNTDDIPVSLCQPIINKLSEAINQATK
jgi:hypothetical protein